MREEFKRKRKKKIVEVEMKSLIISDKTND